MKSIYIFVISNCILIATTIIALAQPGSIDTTFSSDGKVTTEIGSSTDIGNSVAIQADGKIVVAGQSYNGTYYDFALVRYSSDGSLDTSFDSDGKVTTSVASSHDYGNSVAIQSDGKIVVAGTIWKVSYYDYDFALVRYNTDGSLDSTFSSDGKVTTLITTNEDDYGYSVAIQSDGKILVAGYTYNGTNYDFALVRYNSDGSLDNTFDSDGKVTTAIGGADDYGRSIAIQSDGKIVVGGYSNNGSNNDFALVRYNTNGSLDNTFDTDGKVTTAVGSSDDYGYSVAIQSDEKIVMGGNSKIGTNNDFALVRYNSDGSLDNTFDADGKVNTAVGFSTNDYGNSVVIQNDGKIVTGGYSKISTTNDFALVRYNSNGSLDSTFNSDGKVTTDVGSFDDVCNSVAIQSDGKIMVAGKSSNGSDDDLTLIRYNSDGSLDNAFDSDGKVTTAIGRSGDFGESVAIQTDGKIVVAGWSNNGTINVFSLTRYNNDGSLDNTFDTDGKVTTAFGSAWDYGYSVAIQSDGKIVVAGYHDDDVNYNFALVRYKTDGSLDNTFSSDGKVTTNVGGGSHSVAIQSDGKIVVLGYSNNGNDFALVRYNSNGSLDNTFDSDGKVNTYVGGEGYSVAIQSDGKIVAAGMKYISNKNYDFVVLRYNSNGSLDNTFDSDGKVITVIGSSFGQGNSVAIQSDGKIVVAGTGSNGFVLVRYNSNGSLDNTFDSDGKVTTNVGGVSRAVAIQSDGKIVVAGQWGQGFALARYNNDGTLDSTFSCDGEASTSVTGFYDLGNSVAIQSDGKIVVAGYSCINDYNYNYDFTVVRYIGVGVCASITFSQSPTICQGQSITVGSNTYTASGTYIDTLTAANCCDSIVTTNLTVLSNNSFIQNLAICNGQSVIVGSQTYTMSGTFLDTLMAANGCDSVVTTLLTVSDTIKITNNASICNGDSFKVGANIYTVSGTYIDPFIALGGCDSIVTTNLTVLSNSSFIQSLTICKGQSIIVGSQTYTVSGTFMDTLTAANGCDSIVTTLLTVADTIKITNNASICNGDSFSMGANIYTISGTYIDSFTTLNGCDSIITTNLTVLSNSSFIQSLTICNGQSVIVGSKTYTVSGTFMDTLTAANGCDSIVTTLLTVSDTIKITNNVSICNGDSFKVGANIYTVSGTYIDSFIALNGCDSIITTTLNVKQNSSFSQSVSISSGQSLTVGTHTYTTSDTNGTYTDTLIAATANGCDSIITTNLTILTEIKEVNSNNGQWIVNVYPNPFNNNVELKIQNGELELKNVELNIINPVGKIIFMKTLNSNHEILNLDLPNGTYFIRLTQDNKIITTDKLVITN